MTWANEDLHRHVCCETRGLQSKSKDHKSSKCRFCSWSLVFCQPGHRPLSVLSTGWNPKVENDQMLEGKWGAKTKMKRETIWSKKKEQTNLALPMTAPLFPWLLFRPITLSRHAVKQCNISDSCAFLACNVSDAGLFACGDTHGVLGLGTFPPLPDSLRKNKMKIQIEWGCPAFSLSIGPVLFIRQFCCA